MMHRLAWMGAGFNIGGAVWAVSTRGDWHAAAFCALVAGWCAWHALRWESER